MKHVHSFYFSMLKSLLNFNSLAKTITKKQTNKQTNKQTKIYIMKTEFQNLVVRLSFLCHVTDIKVAWINTWICASRNLLFQKVSSMVFVFRNVGERSVTENYHSVDHLSVVRRVFEKLVYNKLVDHLEKCCY